MAESRPGGIGFLNALPEDGERQLMLAVLMDAIRIIIRRRPRTPRTCRVWERERIWFEAEDPSDPFSFASICGALGLDAEYVRRRVLRAPDSWRHVRNRVTLPTHKNQRRDVSII